MYFPIEVMVVTKDEICLTNDERIPLNTNNISKHQNYPIFTYCNEQFYTGLYINKLKLFSGTSESSSHYQRN